MTPPKSPAPCPALTGAALILAVGCSESSPPPAPAPTPPANIVVLTLDTTRADHLGSYGYFRDTSPNLDRLARASLRFERCLAPMANTLPSHASLFTGLEPLEHGALTILGGSGRPLERAGLPALALEAQRAGYSTAAFVSAAPVKRGTGLERGFEHWDEPGAIERPADQTTERALTWLAQGEPGPFLLWVHYFDPHQPLEPPEPHGTWEDDSAERAAFLQARGIREQDWTTRDGPVLDTSTMLDAYDGELRFMDQEIGRLLGALEARPDWDTTAILVVGDHGESLGQHDWLDHDGVWDEQLRVPLFMRVPSEAPRTIERPLGMADVVPTLLARLPATPLAGFVEAAKGRDILATSASEAAIFGSVPADTIVTAEHACSLSTSRWKLLLSMRAEGAERDRLFDLAVDPYERYDVIQEHPERHARMRAQALGPCTELWTRAIEQQPSLEPSGAEAALLKQRIEELRALGYLDDRQP